MNTPAADWWQPVRPLAVAPRDKGIFGASVPEDNPVGTNRRLCWDMTHRVYRALRPEHPNAPGCQGNETKRTFYVCHVCAPWKGK